MIPKFDHLKFFELSGSGLTALASDIAWPASVLDINLDGSGFLAEVPANAFFAATGLLSLSMLELNGNVALRANAFHVKTDSMPSMGSAEEKGRSAAAAREMSNLVFDL